MKFVSVSTVLVLALFSTPARAEGSVYEWVAYDTVPGGEKKLVDVARGVEVALGERAGWKCFVRVDTTEPAGAKRRFDTAVLRCPNGTVGVRTQLEQIDGNDPAPAAPLMITNDAGDKPVRIVLISPRLVKK